jgi:hypothetical protein
MKPNIAQLTKLLLVAGVLVVSSCKKKYDEYFENPNKSQSAPASLIFTGIANDLNLDKPWSNITRWSQFDACNYNYYADQRYDWTGASWNYTTLNNIQRMELEAAKTGLPAVNQYSAIAKFCKAFFYYRMTNLNGDIPLTAALKLDSGLTVPAYNTQKDVFLQILKWLDEANTDLATVVSQTSDARIDGDIYFSKASSWRKVVNAFRLRVLIDLSKKENDADLRVKQQFATIMGSATNYPLPVSEAENLQYIYTSTNKYPSNPDNLGFDATRYNMAATYLDTLVRLNDPRAFVTSEPATAQLRTGKTPADITAYKGAPSGEDLTDMSSKMSDVNNAVYSLRSRSRYYSSYAPEPGIIVGYAEMCFNIAEAINRGWTTGSAEEWYKKGIRTSMVFYGIPVAAAGAFNKVYPYNTPASVTYTIPFDFENVYYQQAAVKYTGNNTTGLNQILLQKYLAFFQNSGWEAFYNYRRTGVPVFSVGTGTGNSGRIPKRFQYPASEQTTNSDNWKKAVQAQFGSQVDDINAEMWLLK